jgi:hypothetical protein
MSYRYFRLFYSVLAILAGIQIVTNYSELLTHAIVVGGLAYEDVRENLMAHPQRVVNSIEKVDSEQNGNEPEDDATEDMVSFRLNEPVNDQDEAFFLSLPSYNVTALQQRKLPTFQRFRQKGGVVVFYHVFKTGGSTIRELLRLKKRKVPYHRERKRLTWTLVNKSLAIAAAKKRPYFIELHIEHPAPDFPTLTQLEFYLGKWRYLAKQRDIPFFAFTIVREPAPFAISFFNYFHRSNLNARWNPYHELAATEDNFRESLVPNRQCVIFGCDPTGQGLVVQADGDRVPCNTCDLERVSNFLLEQMDWVGTVEKLQSETLPLLTNMLLGKPAKGIYKTSANVFAVKKAAVERPMIGNLSATTLEYIQMSSTLDQQIYNRVVETFTLEKLGLDFTHLLAA